MNMNSIHSDATYWKDPEVFRPERHLSPDGRKVIKTDHVLPFSAGKYLFNQLWLHNKLCFSFADL